MKRLISKCPACHETLQVTTLKCPECGMELKNTFDLSPFDLLDNEQFEFLITFLKNRGNLRRCSLRCRYLIQQQKRNWMNCLPP